MKKLIIAYIATTLFLGANLYYCMVQVENLTAASKAQWYELDTHSRKIKAIEHKIKPENMNKAFWEWMDGK